MSWRGAVPSPARSTRDGHHQTRLILAPHLAEGRAGAVHVETAAVCPGGPPPAMPPHSMPARRETRCLSRCSRRARRHGSRAPDGSLASHARQPPVHARSGGSAVGKQLGHTSRARLPNRWPTPQHMPTAAQQMEDALPSVLIITHTSLHHQPGHTLLVLVLENRRTPIHVHRQFSLTVTDS